jgi:hypothetical protein
MSDDTQVFWDISRETLDRSDSIAYSALSAVGINETVVRQISLSNKEPQWMLDLRLKSLEIFRKSKKPTWWPSLNALDLESIYYFAKAEGWGDKKSWDDVPDAIKKTFDRLGIPEAERAVLAGVGAQYDSEVVYHNLRQELMDLWVIFEDMSVAIHESWRYRQEALYESSSTNGSYVCSTSWGCVEWWNFSLSFLKRVDWRSTSGLLPYECTIRRSVWAHSHHRRRWSRGSLYRMM